MVIGDDDGVHLAKAITVYLREHPPWSCCSGYSPHDNPVERIWGAFKAFIANIAVSCPRLR